MRPQMTAREAIADQHEELIVDVEEQLRDDIAYWTAECEDRYEHYLDTGCDCYWFACYELRTALRRFGRLQLRSTKRLASPSLSQRLLLFVPGQVAS